MENSNLNEEVKEMKNDIINKDINFDEYKQRPHDLIKLAYKEANNSKFEEAIDILNKAIEFNLLLENNDNQAYSMARLYVVNSDILIRRITETSDLFGNNAKKEKDSKDKKDDNDDNSEESSEEEDATDEEVVYDNLLTAQKIYEKQIEKENTKEINLKLADVFSLFGELSMCRDNYKDAITYFEKCIDIHRNHDDLFSRSKGDIYFKLGMCHEIDPYKNFICIFYTKVILEKNLELEISKKDPNYKLADFNEIKLLEEGKMDAKIDLDLVKMFNSEIIIKEGDSDEIADLKSILQEIYIKVSCIKFRLKTQ